MLAGYLCGNFSTAYLIGKAKNIDFRKVGSGNLGTTNVMRTLGKKYGLITYFGDWFKVLIPVILVQYVIFAGEDYARLLEIYTGLGAVLGHCYPFWLHFKGGKGVASMSSVMMVHDPVMIPIGVPLFFIVAFSTRYVSVGSLTLSCFFPVMLCIRAFLIDDEPNPYFVHMLILSFVFVFLSFYMHRENIKRLMAGTENKIGRKASVKEKE